MKTIIIIIEIISIYACTITQINTIDMEKKVNVQLQSVNAKQMSNNNRKVELIRELESTDRNLQYLEKQTEIHKKRFQALSQELTRLEEATKKWNDKRNNQ